MAVGDDLAEPDEDPWAPERRELDLMLAGKKPLAMYYELVPMDAGTVPDELYAPHVTSGRFVMREVFEPATRLPADIKDARVRRVLYALPHEAWRINAMLLLCEVYYQQGGWDAGLERMTGKLLGYADEEIEAWLRDSRLVQQKA